jgi:Flp pilus assembly protein TadG
LVLPVLVLVLLAVVQVARVSADYVALQHAVGAAARQAAVEPNAGPVTDAAQRAAPRLDPDRLTVTVSGGARRGDPVTVVVNYQAPTAIPLVGAALGDIELDAQAVVRRE